MAENWKDWQSTIIWVIGLVFICGMTYNTVSGIDDRVTTNTGDIKENRHSIHEDELVQREINTKLQDIPEIKRQIEKLTNLLMKLDYNNGTGE